MYRQRKVREMMKISKCYFVAAIALTSASGCSKESDQASSRQGSEISSYQEFKLSPESLRAFEKSALGGDNDALSKVVNYYLYSGDARTGLDRPAAVRWLNLGADRGIKEYIVTMLYLLRPGDLECVTVKSYFTKIDDSQVLEDIRNENEFVRNCA